MQISLIRSKIHRARVTSADLDYVGSITIDSELLAQSGIVPYEKVLVADVTNGNRLETYVLPGEANSRIIQLNGAAAHLIDVGDRVIIMAFAYIDFPPPANWAPRVLVMDEENRVVQTLGECLT